MEQDQVTMQQAAAVLGCSAQQIRNLAKKIGVGQRITTNRSAIMLTGQEVEAIARHRKDHPVGRRRKDG